MPRYQLTAVPGIIRGGGFFIPQHLAGGKRRAKKCVQRHAEKIGSRASLV